MARREELLADRGRVKTAPNRNRDSKVVVLRREREALKIENDELRQQLERSCQPKLETERQIIRAVLKRGSQSLEVPCDPLSFQSLWTNSA